MHEAVYRTLRDRLMRGEFAAGQVLGMEELAEALGTSTMPVREALKRLAEQRALQRTASRSMRVPPLSLERLDDLRRSRVLVEGALTEWATPQCSRSEISTLKQLAGRIARALKAPAALEEALQHNQVFHFTLYAAARSPALLSVVESLWLQSGPYLRAARELMQRATGLDLAMHDRVVQAIAEGNAADARAALEEDVSWAFDRLRQAPERLQGLAA